MHMCAHSAQIADAIGRVATMLHSGYAGSLRVQCNAMLCDAMLNWQSWESGPAPALELRTHLPTELEQLPSRLCVARHATHGQHAQARRPIRLACIGPEVRVKGTPGGRMPVAMPVTSLAFAMSVCTDASPSCSRCSDMRTTCCMTPRSASGATEWQATGAETISALSWSWWLVAPR